MSMMNQIGDTISSALKRLEEKNRRSAQLNRIRAVLKREGKAAEKEYISLGRYYYQNLRQKDNKVTEPHCLALEKIERRMEAAVDELERLYLELAEEKARKEIAIDDIYCYDEDPTMIDNVVEKAEHLKEKTKEVVQTAGEVVKETTEKVTQFTQEHLSDLKDKAGNVKDDIAVAGTAIKDDIQAAAAQIREDLTDKRGESKIYGADSKENDNLPFEGN